MSKRVSVELNLPDDLVSTLRGQDLAAKAREALVMELLREHHISQSKAAELLGIARDDLFARMAKYQIPVIDLSAEELRSELQEPFPR